MAFECQQSTKIGFKDRPLDNPGKAKIASKPVPLLNTRKNSISESENAKLVSAKDTRIPTNEALPHPIRSITDLPSALISEIFNSLGAKELGIVSCVNTSLYKIASEHHVWKEFYCERWGPPIFPANTSDEKSWKEIFTEREFRSKIFMGRYTIDTLYGHDQAVRTIFVLASKKLVFTSGYDQIVRMWDLEEGLLVMSSRPLGCTIRAVAADSMLLVAGGTDGFIHGWKAEEGNPNLFDIRGLNGQTTEFNLWEHEGPITCLALDFGRIYSGSWDMTVRVWDRATLKCVNVLVHNDWVWSLVPHGTTLASSAGSDAYLWDVDSGCLIGGVDSVHVGNTFALARSHTGNLLFTGGEDGAIHMFEVGRIGKCDARKVSTWVPHNGSVYALAFEYPWLVSASSDGKISLIDVRKLLKKKTNNKCSLVQSSDAKNVEPPQRMLHGFGSNLFSVGVGLDRIVCGGEEGVVRIWNFSQALEIEQRASASKGIRLENRMRRRKLQDEISSKGIRGEQCLVAAKKNVLSGDRNGWCNKRRVSGKVKG